MCVEIASNNINNMDINIASSKTKKLNKKKISYSIKKLLRQLFTNTNKYNKSQKLIISQNLENTKKADSYESLESLENMRNANIELSECQSLESYENDINERLLAAGVGAGSPAAAAAAVTSCEMEDYEFDDITSVPVHFVRTEHGTFFWTAASDIASDNDLIAPLYCCTSNQIATIQYQDRWAQA